MFGWKKTIEVPSGEKIELEIEAAFTLVRNTANNHIKVVKEV